MSGLDVAGGAVGIASLGIQVCQGLLTYYDGWKSYNKDIQSAYDAVADLSRTLGLLTDSLGRGQLDQERADRVTACLSACESGLIELSAKLQELRRHSTPDGFREKVLQKAQRAWYPLRTETLVKLRENVESIQGRLLLALQALQLDTTLALEATLTRMSLSQRSDSVAKMNDWLSPPDPWTNHAAARKKHEPQTGDWLLQCDEYRRWKAGTTRHLWISGKAGCGKTVLCSTVVEQVQLFCLITPKTAFAIFYFTFSEIRKQKYEDLLRSLVVQLGSKEPGLSIVLQARDKTPGKVTAVDELENILHGIIHRYDRVFLLLDALDESPEEDDERDLILSRIEEIVRRARNISLLVTSRELREIRSTFESIQAAHISVEDRVVDSDIQLYISSEISKHSGLNKLPDDLKTHIEQTVSQKANGMFRWAYCQLQEVKKLRALKPKYISKVLNDLPKTLDETYERILVGLDEMYRAEALTLLHWLAYSRRPLTLAELSEAGIVDPDSEEAVALSERGVPEDTLEILRDLVVVEASAGIKYGYSKGSSDAFLSDDSNSHGRNSIVKLAHFSVKEYLESQRARDGEAKYAHLTPGSGHHFLAQSCLTYLQHCSETEREDLADLDRLEFPLLDYAVRYWYKHSALQLPAETRREVEFLTDSTRLREWTSLRGKVDSSVNTLGHYLEYGFRDAAGASEQGPFCASWLGLDAVLSAMLGSMAPNDRNIASSQALYAAAYQNHAKIVELMLKFGADPNHYSALTRNRTALEGTSYCGHLNTIQLLLDQGADANTISESGCGTALIAASEAGHLEIVQLLLDQGADVNTVTESGYHWTALIAASANAQAEVVRLLLKHGADVNTVTESKENGTALIAASAEGAVEVVRMLLKHGADVNTVSKSDYGTALIAASYQGMSKVVQLLLNYGADVNAAGGEYGTALLAAIWNHGVSFRPDGNFECISLPLGHGADMSIAGGKDNLTPLEKALSYGNVEVVELLRSRGAKEPETTRWEDLLEERKGWDD